MADSFYSNVSKIGGKREEVSEAREMKTPTIGARGLDEEPDFDN